MLVLVGALLLLSASAVPPPTSMINERVLSAAPLDGEIVIDGYLDDAAWAAAPVATGFTQQRPDPGRPASERTEVRVLYDRRNIYVGMRMFDAQPDSIAAQLGRRDATDLHADRAHVMIDSYFDRRNAFRFVVNPAGVKMDVMQFNDVNEDVGWNAVWDVATQIDSLGWTAEFRIPISQLRFSVPEHGEMIWGINFIRDIARRNERSFWAPVPPDAGRMVSLAGELRGLDIPHPPARLELLPYTAARIERAPVLPDDPFRSATGLGADAGLDIMYGVGPNLTLNATINPDFGQVEVDPAVVNLSAFETFFPERRPFFLERADIFRFSLTVGDGGNESLFYSRRIGRAPRGRPPGSALFVDVPGGSRILGAAKLTGRLNGLNVGFLGALSDQVVARYVDPDGLQHRLAVEPPTTYAVARVSHDFRAGRSGVGLLGTAVLRNPTDHLQFLPSSAYALGLDARHRFLNDEWESVLSLAGSHVIGHETAISALQRAPGRYYQRPDATHLTFDPERTSLTGATARLQVGRATGSWRGGTILYARTPGFEVNDLGFQNDYDLIVGGFYLTRLQFQPGRTLRRWNVGSNLFRGWTLGGENIFMGYNANGGLELLNGWGGNAGVEFSPRTLSTPALRGGPALLQSPRANGWMNLYSDRRRPLHLNLSSQWFANLETGGGRMSVNPSAAIRPMPWLSASLGPGLAWNRDHAQYIATLAGPGGTLSYLHGRIDQATVSLNTRLNVTFSPDLTLELFAQPFVSAVSYSEYKVVADPRAHRFSDRFTEYTGEVPDPSFNFRSLRGNAVLRWEYRPGSTVFFVWQQQRTGLETVGDFDFGRDFTAIFREPAEHVLLVKLTYWLGR